MYPLSHLTGSLGSLLNTTQIWQETKEPEVISSSSLVRANDQTVTELPWILGLGTEEALPGPGHHPRTGVPSQGCCDAILMLTLQS